jgi:hypothetical protein
MQSAWNKYGAEGFTFTVIELVDQPADLLRVEQIWLDILFVSLSPDEIYNNYRTAGSPLGSKHSLETRRKISEAHKGRNIGRKLTEEHKAKIAKSLIGNKRGVGRKQTPEHIQAVRDARARMSEERKREISAKKSAASRGIKKSEETRQRMSIAAMGHKRNVGRKYTPRSEEHRSNHAKTVTGKVRTQEQRNRQSKAHRRGALYTMIAPDGTVYEDIGIISEFAREHGLTKRTATLALHGSQNRAGWRGYITKEDDP